MTGIHFLILEGGGKLRCHCYLALFLSTACSLPGITGVLELHPRILCQQGSALDSTDERNKQKIWERTSSRNHSLFHPISYYSPSFTLVCLSSLLFLKLSKNTILSGILHLIILPPGLVFLRHPHGFLHHISIMSFKPLFMSPTY